MKFFFKNHETFFLNNVDFLQILFIIWEFHLNFRVEVNFELMKKIELHLFLQLQIETWMN